MPVPVTCGALSRNRRTVLRVRWTRSSAKSLDSIFFPSSSLSAGSKTSSKYASSVRSVSRRESASPVDVQGTAALTRVIVAAEVLFRTKIIATARFFPECPENGRVRLLAFAPICRQAKYRDQALPHRDDEGVQLRRRQICEIPTSGSLPPVRRA